MRCPTRFDLRTAAVTFLVVVLLTPKGSVEVRAGEAYLKNGMLLEGKLAPIQGLTKGLIKQTQGPVNIYPILMIHSGLKRYFVGNRQVKELNKAEDLSRFETFKLKQPRLGRKLMLSSIGSLTDVTPFDEFGRRRVTVQTARGPVHIIQGITEIAPKHVTVTGLSHMWEHGIATSAIPYEILNRILRKATDGTDPDDRMAIARFYLQAGLYRHSSVELDSIIKDFPELKKRVEEVKLELRQLQARQLIRELRRRRDAGQHRLAYSVAKQFPVKDMSAAVLREVREFIGEYEESRNKGENALALLGEMQAKLSNSSQVNRLAPLRAEIRDQLDYESMGRLAAFLNLADDESLGHDERLSLAYTGWVLGNENAGSGSLDLDKSIRLWKARFLVLQYLRSEDQQQRENLVESLKDLEGIGPEQIMKLIPHLPLPRDASGTRAGVAQRIDVTPPDSELPVAYSVLLPQGYTPHHRYRMIVSLRPRERTAEQMLTWWGGTAEKPGQSQRRGYIVISPEYLDKEETEYSYSAKAHYIVIQSMRDARKRFNIDSDRIFLSGHGTGGDAAFDIGMSHPDLFAGVIPVTGISDKYCKWYWSNAKRLAWYIVGGELDRDSLTRNARELNRMMRLGFDVIYAEYIGRGYESYYSEIHQMFDWMDLHQRVKFVKEIEANVLRPTDNRFFWIKLEGMPRNVIQADVLAPTKTGRISPMLLQVTVTPGNSIYIRRSGAEKHTIWLSPDFIDFDKRIMVRWKGRQKFNDFVKAELETILEDLRIRGDRQKIYWAKIVID